MFPLKRNCLEENNGARGRKRLGKFWQLSEIQNIVVLPVHMRNGSSHICECICGLFYEVSAQEYREYIHQNFGHIDKYCAGRAISRLFQHLMPSQTSGIFVQKGSDQ